MFTEFFKDEDEHVRDAARQVEALRMQMDKGELNPSEFEELSGDILDLDKIEELADSIERAAYIEKAFKMMLIVVKGLIKP